MSAVAAQKHEQAGEAEPIEFMGHELLIDPRGVLVWPAESLMVVADLHLEKAAAIASKQRTLLPPYDTRETLNRLSGCLACWQPRRVICLGDSFHTVKAAEHLSDTMQDLMSAMMLQRDWIWITGNHDPMLPKVLGGVTCQEIALACLRFRHEPEPDCEPGEVAGHLHPKAKIRRRGKSVSRRCLAGDEKRLILPAFGAFTGGLNVRDPAFEGLFSPRSLTAWMLGRNTVHRISGRNLVR